MGVLTIFKTTIIYCAVLFAATGSAQTPGCTDPAATNYDAAATINDGSCTYTNVAVTPYAIKTLSDTLQETSGLIYYNNKVWTNNDNTDLHLYALDTASGNITAQVLVQNGINLDWEELTQDSDYVYIGDFGNNLNGNRTDLHILRVAKADLAGGSVTADTIRFAYADQTSFTPTGNNNTDFDCEAFIATDDSLYLFTKQWASKKTSVYALPKVPSAGVYTATLKYSHDVQGLITGAVYIPGSRAIVLSGYNTNGSSFLIPFVYLLYDFPGDQLFAGNKRKIDVVQPFSQIEGITTADGRSFFLSNEKLGISPLTIPARLQQVDLTAYLQPYYQSLTAEAPVLTAPLLIYPNPAENVLTVQLSAAKAVSAGVLLSDDKGTSVRERTYLLSPGTNELVFDVTGLASGHYQMTVFLSGTSFTRSVLLGR